MNGADTLRAWAELGRLHQVTRLKRNANWLSVRHLIDAAKPKLAADGKELRRLLEKSRRKLHPFGDPFDLDLGMHRWLTEDREEAYSDWLQWIVEQVGRPALVYQMFNLKTPADIATWQVSPNVEREIPVTSGNIGRAGRIDLIIRYNRHALIIIEVKKGRAEDADTGKQRGYAKWARQQPEPDKHLVLLVTDGHQDSYDSFTRLTWGHICVFLRQLAAKKNHRREHAATALFLAFAGAVEQNLLGIRASHIRKVADGETQLFNPEIVDHLRAALK